MSDKIKNTFPNTDQSGRPFHLENYPRRIVSLVPSLTELICDLGMSENLVGVTRFCVHPKDLKSEKTIIGGTKKIKMDRILDLNPDIVIANKEENNKADVEELSKHFPVWTTDISTLQKALRMIEDFGVLFDRSEKAQVLGKRIQNDFKFLETEELHEALYLIWRNPWMSIGGDTFISDMMHRAGFENILKKESRYPEITDDQIIELQPKFVLLSSEPFPFKEKHISELQNLLPDSKILLVDGEMFSWYGSRLQHSAVYFRSLLNRIRS